MGCDIDTIDLERLFSDLPTPACVLEPVMGERDVLSDVSFGHTNEAFRKWHADDAKQGGLMPFLRHSGFDGSNLLRALSRMRPGERKNLSFDTAEKAN